MAFSAIYDLVIDDRDVRIYSNGTGDPVLMLPDLGSSAASWECLTGEVCEHGRQIVAVDLPGTGHCDPVRGSDLSAFVDHLQRLVEHLGSEPIDLVGCGFGGYLAASVAAKDPQLIRRLVLENPSLPPRSGPAGQQPDGARHGDQRGGDDAAARPDQAEHARLRPREGGARAAGAGRPEVVGVAVADHRADARHRQRRRPRRAIGHFSTCWPPPSPARAASTCAGSKRGHASDPRGFCGGNDAVSDCYAVPAHVSHPGHRRAECQVGQSVDIVFGQTGRAVRGSWPSRSHVNGDRQRQTGGAVKRFVCRDIIPGCDHVVTGARRPERARPGHHPCRGRPWAGQAATGARRTGGGDHPHAVRRTAPWTPAVGRRRAATRRANGR